MQINNGRSTKINDPANGPERRNVVATPGIAIVAIRPHHCNRTTTVGAESSLLAAGRRKQGQRRRIEAMH